MKQRLEATHFIEVWKTIDGEIENTFFNEISQMEEYLQETIDAGHKTIAIWKIKYKGRG